MTTKICNHCNQEKELNFFHTAKRTKLGVIGTCKQCVSAKKKQFWLDNPDKYQEEIQRQRGYREAVKQKVFDHYGEQCSCCGESQRIFLTLDHVNNDGAAHRRSLNKANNARSTSADKVWRIAIKDGFPDSFQILCYNCNCGKRDNGGVCPHKDAK